MSVFGLEIEWEQTLVSLKTFQIVQPTFCQSWSSHPLKTAFQRWYWCMIDMICFYSLWFTLIFSV